MGDEDSDVDDRREADRRAMKNARERQQRNSIKDSFAALQDSAPPLWGTKASPPPILKVTACYVMCMERGNTVRQRQIEDLWFENMFFEEQIREVEKARAATWAGDPINRKIERSYRVLKVARFRSRRYLRGLPAVPA